LSEPLLVYPSGSLLAAIVGNEKLSAASSAAICILAVMRRFRD
jgi:hypothetical protein